MEKYFRVVEDALLELLKKKSEKYQLAEYEKQYFDFSDFVCQRREYEQNRKILIFLEEDKK